MGTGIFTTACPRNCYSTCTLNVQVADGRIRRIEPHPGNRATPGGACLKGLSYVERVHSPDRILHPLRRRPGEERLREDLLGRRAGRDRRAVAGAAQRSRSAERPVLRGQRHQGAAQRGWARDSGGSFGGYTTTYGDLCWPAGLEATRLTLGENKHNAPWDIARSKLIVLWGKNAAETNLHQMVFIDDALDAGARLVVIDPRRTESAERAALLIQPRPGTDGALALGVAHLLIERDLDRPRVRRPTRDRLRDASRRWCGRARPAGPRRSPTFR